MRLRPDIYGFAPFIASAVLAAAAMDFPQTLWPLMFGCLVPILMRLDTHPLSDSRRALYAEFARMFVFGFVFFVLSTPWIASMYPLTWLNINDPSLSIVIVAALWIGLAATLSVPIMPWIYVMHRVRRLGVLQQAVVGACVWILLEYVRSWLVALALYGDGVLFGPHHTYYSFAYPLSNAPYLRDLFALGGLYLVSFLVVLTNFFLFNLWRYRHAGHDARRNAVLGVILALMLLLGGALISHIRAGDGDGTIFTMTLLNTHLPSSSSEKIAQRKTAVGLELAAHAQNQGGVVILPENVDVLNSYLEAKRPTDNPLSKFRLVIGSHPQDNAHAMYFFETESKQGVSYRKQLMMPIGEYNVAWIGGLVRFSGNATWMSTYGRSVSSAAVRGDGISLYQDKAMPEAIYGGSICSENISPYIFRDETRAGATVLTGISALSPFRNSATLARQMRSIDTARALEEGRYFAVAGNDTESFVITDTGRLAAISHGDGNSSFEAPVQVKTYRTPYATYGDYMLTFALGMLVLVALWRRS